MKYLFLVRTNKEKLIKSKTYKDQWGRGQGPGGGYTLYVYVQIHTRGFLHWAILMCCTYVTIT